MEIFKEVKGFEGEYEISNYGNVKSLKNNVILKNVLMPSGYYYIYLCKNGKKYNKRVNRLVAEAFLPNPHNLPQVNHKDENKQNNRVWINNDGSVDYEKSNLEWCSHKYNVNYGTRTKRASAKMKGKKLSEEHKAKIGAKNRGRKPSEETKRKISETLKGKPNIICSKPVVSVDMDGNVLEFNSTCEAGRNGFCQTCVAACCRNCYGKLGNFYKGYYWYFKSDWLEMKNAATRKRETAYQLEINFD